MDGMINDARRRPISDRRACAPLVNFRRAMSLPTYTKGRAYQESWGCLFAFIFTLALLITALGYWIGAHL
jgi:hypothetical protein